MNFDEMIILLESLDIAWVTEADTPFTQRVAVFDGRVSIEQSRRVKHGWDCEWSFYDRQLFQGTTVRGPRAMRVAILRLWHWWAVERHEIARAA